MKGKKEEREIYKDWVRRVRDRQTEWCSALSNVMKESLY